MRSLSPLRRAIGLVLLMIGFTWLLLGAGVLQGSVMTGRVEWAVVGGVIAVIGIGVLTLKTKPKPTADQPPPREPGA